MLSGGGIIILHVIRRHFLAAAMDPSCQPLHVQYSSDGSCSLTMLTMPRGEHHGGGRRRGLGRGRRDSGSPHGRTTRVHWFGCHRRRITGAWVSRGMTWPAVGVVGGGEAFTASQPATGGRSTRHDRCWFGPMEQEDQRLKKHYGRWMDIVRSLELESFILTKLTKPSVPVNLVGPQVSLPLYWVRGNRGSIHLFVRNKEALPCCGRGPICQPLHVQSTSDGNRSLTTLTTPRREHQGGDEGEA